MVYWHIFSEYLSELSFSLFQAKFWLWLQILPLIPFLSCFIMWKILIEKKWKKKHNKTKQKEILQYQTSILNVILMFTLFNSRFFLGGTPSWQNLVNPPPPHPALVPFFRPESVLPHLTFVPEIFTILVYFCIDSDYFKLETTLQVESCISCLKHLKFSLGVFGASAGNFC